MQSFHYHPETGEFLGQSAAMPDPLEEGRFLIPAHATDAPPPESGQNNVAVFDGQSWVLKPDFRGTVYWLSHGDKHTITEIGETVPEGAFLEEPEAPEPEPQYKTQFSVLEFRDRFTIEEQLDIRQAQFNDMEVGLVYDNFQAAQFIDIEDQRVSQGLDLYISKGLLEPGRKTELLEPELIEP